MHVEPLSNGCHGDIRKKQLCTHTKIIYIIAETEENVAAFLLHGSRLTKIGNINQIVQCTIKKTAGCYRRSWFVSQIRDMLGGETGKFTSWKNKVTS
jgi:hypothetical protein